MSTELEQVGQAIVAFDKVAAGIAALREAYTGVIYPVTTTKGMDAAKEARRAIREPRVEVERVRQSAKAPILALGRQLDERAKRITAELVAIETPIDEQIKTEEARKEAERVARVEAERQRIESLQGQIADIAKMPLQAVGKPANQVQALLTSASEMTCREETFAEFTATARKTLADTVEALQKVLADRIAWDLDQAEAAQLWAQRDAEEAERADLERRKRISEDEERARRAEEQATEARRIEAERKQLDTERAAFEASRAPPPAVTAPTAHVAEQTAPQRQRPSLEEMSQVLAAHYGVAPKLVIEWIRSQVVKP